MRADNSNLPLVSIFCFCKDRASSIGRCIESVLNQTYTNFEFVIQDGASTDGTLEIIKSYSDPRIKLLSEPDSGHSEAFWKVLQRCQGEFIGSCLSDEELLPQAISEAVEIFAQHPRLGALTRDGQVMDSKGKITGEFIAGEFDFVDYLFGRYCPMWVSSFFRRKALLDIGLGGDDWTLACLEFEIWCRLATRHSVKYVPGIVAKYGVDTEGQLSNSPAQFSEHLDSRARVIEKMFSEDGFFGEDLVKKIGCLYNQNFLFYNHSRALRRFEPMKVLYGRLMDIEKQLGSARTEYKALFSGFTVKAVDPSDVVQRSAEVYGRAWRQWIRLSIAVPGVARRLFPPKWRAAIRRTAMRAFHALYDFTVPQTGGAQPQTASEHAMYGLPTPVYSKRLYHDVAMLYYGRGNIEYAQLLWRKAEAAGDLTIDSLAVQAALFSPSATNESLLAVQRRWAERHTKPIPGLEPLKPRRFIGDRPIRVGYCCSFFDSDVFRTMFVPVLEHHDREKVTAIAYSVTPAERDIREVFDDWKVVGVMPDRDFVNLVRNDEIDILVELTGFSPMHRFAAMASRCAPIQIAHFNHSGTCGVPNVDYVFADAISILPEEEKYYSEKVWRLEGDFLFFNYDWAALPKPSDPPHSKTGRVTFSCFGTPAKLSDELIELWARILQAVPDARMYIRNAPLSQKTNREYLLQRFGSHGIASSRLWLDGATDWRTFMKSYEDVDISLDTWPYCGANTVAEALWQGVPVVTLKGNRFSSRYGSSHVIAAGCPELVADSPQRYVEIAVQLAASPDRLAHYRRNLREMTRKHGLSDPVRFARKLDKAYLEMMQVLHAGTRPNRALVAV